MATNKEVEHNPAGSAVQVDAASVFGASVPLPMFDRAEPDAWFILADANFKEASRIPAPNIGTNSTPQLSGSCQRS